MSDIHQEWRELREKNGNFINHIDGELAKIEKEKRLLDGQKGQLQNPTDAVAFAMQFVAPPPFDCCQDDRDILKALNCCQADRIEILEKELIACKEQQQIDLAVKKDLDEKLNKVTADYQALFHENLKLREDFKLAKSSARMMSDAYIKAIDENADLKKQLDATKKELADFIAMYDKAAAEAHQAKVAKDRMGYSNRCMQSKIAKQSNEIKRLIDDNIHQDEYILSLKKKLNELTEENSATKTAYKFLKQALGASAKDADANFDRGYHKGMDELWDAIRKAQDERPSVLTDIYGQGCMYDCVSNLSAQDFANKTIEWEEKQAKDIQIGDEVEIFDTFCPDDDPHSDIGIVIAIDNGNPCFSVVGPNFESCFDETYIKAGHVRKTGKHFDTIPLDYFN